jgi:RNAse (barnase) inhibitor barstar
MLFPKLEQLTRVWRAVVESVTSNRLGPTAKVATDEGKPDDRLICIYTKVGFPVELELVHLSDARAQDFRDEDDVTRVLLELEATGLLNSGRTIYYKTDAFTYLDLYKQTASDYGLQASLYNSSKVIATSRHSKVTEMSPSKRQSTLLSYF